MNKQQSKKAKRDAISAFSAPDSARREQTRPKNAGVHSDQLKRVHTKHNRRVTKQALRRGDWA